MTQRTVISGIKTQAPLSRVTQTVFYITPPLRRASGASDDVQATAGLTAAGSSAPPTAGSPLASLAAVGSPFGSLRSLRAAGGSPFGSPNTRDTRGSQLLSV